MHLSRYGLGEPHYTKNLFASFMISAAKASGDSGVTTTFRSVNLRTTEFLGSVANALYVPSLLLSNFPAKQNSPPLPNILVDCCIASVSTLADCNPESSTLEFQNNRWMRSASSVSRYPRMVKSEAIKNMDSGITIMPVIQIRLP